MRSPMLVLGATVFILAGSAMATPAADPSPSMGTSAAHAGRIVYAFRGAGEAESHVYSVAPDGTDVRRLVPWAANGPWVSADGSRVQVYRELADGRIATSIVGVDGTGPTDLPLPDDQPLSLGPGPWSPDGTRLALEGFSDADPTLNGIRVVDADGSHAVRLTTPADPASSDRPIAWSPDGRWLLYATVPFDSDEGPLFAIPVAGGDPVRLTPDGQHVWLTGFGAPASWSADSGMVAFSAFKDGTAGVSAPFIAGLDGSPTVQLDEWSTYDTGARFSPDGALIVFDHAVAGTGEHQLFLVRPDGSDLTQLTDHDTVGMGVCCAAWSPDGASLVFQGGPDSAATLFTIGVDGTGARPVRTDPGEYADYAWR